MDSSHVISNERKDTKRRCKDHLVEIVTNPLVHAHFLWTDEQDGDTLFVGACRTSTPMDVIFRSARDLGKTNQAKYKHKMYDNE